MNCIRRAAVVIANIMSAGVGRTYTASASLVGLLAVVATASGATAGSRAYDLNTMLDEPHPFAQAPTALPPLAPQAQSPAAIQAPYPAAASYFPSRAAPAAEQKRDDTLIGLFGFREGETTSPAQVATSAMIPPALAQAAAGPPPAKKGDPSFITIGGGWYDFNDNEQAAEFRAEWRGKKLFWVFKPFVGAMGTSDAALYGYAGFLTDFFFGRRIVVTPSIAAGLYENGDGKDLGSIIEFRSGLEIGWRFDNRSRLSAMVYHISNASIDDNNPGTEVFSIGYSFPLD